MTELEKFVWEVGGNALRPEKRMSVSEWADRYRVLSGVSSAEPGPWRTSRTPYLKEIMEALSNSSPYEKVVFMKGSQIGGSECGFNWIGYIIHHAPGPLLHVMPTIDIANEQSKTRIVQMINDCPMIKGLVSEEKSRDSGNSMRMKMFPGGFWAMTGANSPSSLRSKPIRYLFFDEVDAAPGDVGGEGDPVNLAIARTRTYSRRKIFLCSSPTFAGHSRIETEYENTDKRRFYVPCPRCGGYQVLTFPHLKWEKSNPSGAWYECEHCGGKIHNHEKSWMLERGEWRAENPSYTGKSVGFHLSALYSPVGWYSWGEIASQFVESKNKPQLLKTFVNTVLGETWQDKGDAPEWERLFYRREAYEVGKVPEGGLFLTAGVDVQKDRLEAQIIAWGRNKENWSVDYRVFPGDTADLSSECWKSLDNLISETFEHEHGATLNIRCLAIDTGYNTNVVYSWARRYPAGRVIAVDGRDSLAVMVGQPKAVDVSINGQKKAKALKLWPVGVSLIKSELYGWLRLQKPESGETMPHGYCHFPEYPEEFFKQLCSEQMLAKETKGRTVFMWEKWYNRNEALDTFVYARAAASLLQMDKFTDSHWSQLEEAVGATPNKQGENSEKPAPGPRPSQSRYTRKIYSKGVNL